MANIENVTFFKRISYAQAPKENFQFFGSKIDVVISDMAENTTGNKNLDSIRTNNLCLEVLKYSLEILKKKGTLVSKTFMGRGFF